MITLDKTIIVIIIVQQGNVKGNKPPNPLGRLPYGPLQPNRHASRFSFPVTSPPAFELWLWLVLRE